MLSGPARASCGRLHFIRLDIFVPICILLIIVIGYLSHHPLHANTSTPPHAPDRGVLRYQTEAGRGVRYRTFISGEQFTYELPKTKNIKGVVFNAHGCRHSGSDLWPPQHACPHCLGLPEEILWRRATVARGYAVLGISTPTNKTRLLLETRCWRRDAAARLAVDIRHAVSYLRLGHVPFYVMGASSGASLVMSLPQHMPEIQGVYAQIKGIEPEQLLLPAGRKYPPIAFVHMPVNDPGNAQLVVEGIASLTKAGTPAAQAFVHPRPLTVEFLTARADGHIDGPMAQKILEIIELQGYLHKSNRTLNRNMKPLTKAWLPIMQPVVGDMSLEVDKSIPGELFNVAYARHEFIHDHVDAVWEWLEGGGRGAQERMDALLAADQAKSSEAAEKWARELRKAGWN